MKKKKKEKMNGSICPACGSTNITQVADHSSSGYNGYVCNDCGTHFGD